MTVCYIDAHIRCCWLHGWSFGMSLCVTTALYLDIENVIGSYSCIVYRTPCYTRHTLERRIYKYIFTVCRVTALSFVLSPRWTLINYNFLGLASLFSLHPGARWSTRCASLRERDPTRRLCCTTLAVVLSIVGCCWYCSTVFCIRRTDYSLLYTY